MFMEDSTDSSFLSSISLNTFCDIGGSGFNEMSALSERDPCSLQNGLNIDENSILPIPGKFLYHSKQGQ